MSVQFSVDPRVLRERQLVSPGSVPDPAEIQNVLIGVVMPDFGLPSTQHVPKFVPARLKTAYDDEAEVWVVTGYPGLSITFEASSIDQALQRAMEIVPDVFESRGIKHQGIMIVIDQFSSLAAMDD